jgi:hypothetical protein
MKNIFLSFVVIVSILAVSCKKDNETKPASPASAPVAINVEYKIVSESANVEVAYMAPNAEGKLEMKSETVTRSEYSISFASTKGNFFSVEAANVNSARKMVHVQILIDGVVFQEASSNSQKVIASGNY